MVKNLFFIFVLLLLISCSKSPKSDEATVSEAVELGETDTSSKTYAINNEASKVSWIGTKPTGRHNGTFQIKEGSLQVKDNKIIGGTIKMDLNNIEVLDLQGEDKDKLTNHLKSADFFDVANHPEAVFQITSVESYENENVLEDEVHSELRVKDPNAQITGNLSLRDTTLSISFPAKIEYMEEVIKAQANFNIDRTRWNVSYRDEANPINKTQDQFIYNKVNIGLNIEASKDEVAKKDI